MIAAISLICLSAFGVVLVVCVFFRVMVVKVLPKKPELQAPAIIYFGEKNFYSVIADHKALPNTQSITDNINKIPRAYIFSVTLIPSSSSVFIAPSIV